VCGRRRSSFFEERVDDDVSPLKSAPLPLEPRRVTHALTQVVPLRLCKPKQTMAVSQRIIGARAQKFNKRIHARGQEIESAKVRRTTRKKEEEGTRRQPLARDPAPGPPTPPAVARRAWPATSLGGGVAHRTQ
jgi:hypothetical protein